jgi:hypothetical protein
VAPSTDRGSSRYGCALAGAALSPVLGTLSVRQGGSSVGPADSVAGEEGKLWPFPDLLGIGVWW